MVNNIFQLTSPSCVNISLQADTNAPLLVILNTIVTRTGHIGIMAFRQQDEDANYRSFSANCDNGLFKHPSPGHWHHFSLNY